MPNFPVFNPPQDNGLDLVLQEIMRKGEAVAQVLRLESDPR
jgi:hypothetical protein